MASDMAGFGRLSLNPNALPFIPNLSNYDHEYNNYYYDTLHLHHLHFQNYHYYYSYVVNTSPAHFLYYPNPDPNPSPTHVINFLSPPPPDPVVVSSPVAPPPATSRGKRGRKSKNWFWKRGGASHRKHPLMRVDPQGQFTTVMIRNVPNQYTREMVREFLDQHCSFANSCYHEGTSAYDFLYLPIDFGTKVNKGFAFVNFTDPRAVWRFHRCCANQKWAHFRSSKRCDVTYARLQGKEALEEHFAGIKLECTEEEYLPVVYSPARDGSGAIVAERTIGVGGGIGRSIA